MKKKFLNFFMLLLCSNISVSIYAQQTNIQDSLALVDLYNNTNGVNWTDHTNWLTGPVSTWYGVEVTETRVTVINLPNNNLSGSIPSSFGNLANLNFLYLSKNQISGSIPPELGQLAILSELDLDSNQLSGSIPPELGNLSDLRYLLLSNNQLSGGIPPELGNLSILRRLDLSNNQLGGTIPPVNFGQKRPKKNISHNRFTFAGMEKLVKRSLNIRYSPQANIPVHSLNDSSLYVSAGGRLKHNTYKWFMVGQADHVTIQGDSVFHPSQNGKYYAKVTNSICVDLTLYTDTVDFSNAMPVTIINLKAQLQKSLVKIDWTSVTEINVSRYEIQHSANATNFITIGSLAAKGNGTAQQDYTFNDLQPQQGNNYYRLKIIDKDGTTNYSIIVLVNITGNKTITLVYPVPAKDLLHIQTSGNASFSLLNQSGKILLTANISGSGTMNVSSIAAGLYYLKNNSNGEMTKIMIVR